MTDYSSVWKTAEQLQWCAFVTTGRTGSDFFHSLIDSHPEILVFNGQIQFDQFWFDTAKSLKVEGEPDVNDLAYEFISFFLSRLRSRYDLFDRKNQLGKNQNQSFDVNLDEFREHLVGLMTGRPVTSATFLRAVYVAYGLCTGQDIAMRKVIFHHLHQVKRLPQFLEDVPDAKVLFMTRDPRAIYVSGVEHWRNHYPIADNPAFPMQILHRTHTDMEKLMALGDTNIMALRLEDLGNKAILENACEWLGVSYSKTMEQSTWGGLRWWGDKISSNRAAKEEKGFSPNVIKNNWEQKLVARELAIFDLLYGHALEKYGYPYRDRSNGLAKLWIALAIWLPNTYEQKYLSPVYLISKLAKGRIKDVLRALYHPLRRARFQSWVRQQAARGGLTYPNRFTG